LAMAKSAHTLSVVPAEEQGRLAGRHSNTWSGKDMRANARPAPAVYCAFAQAAMMGLLAGVRARQVADRSVGKVAAILVAPQ
jgi:hypothetical protein